MERERERERKERERERDARACSLVAWQQPFSEWRIRLLGLSILNERHRQRREEKEKQERTCQTERNRELTRLGERSRERTGC